MASTSAGFFSNPAEVIKIRMQLSGELNQVASKQYTSFLDAVRKIWRQEGIRGIQSGLAPALAFQVCLNGTRLGTYKTIRNRVEGVFGDSVPAFNSWLAGATAGALGAFVGSPVNLVKCRLQAQSAHFQARETHGYKGMVDGLRTIARTEGVRGLYRGVIPAMARIATGSSVQLMSYDTAKAFSISTLGLNDGPPAHIAASLLAGALTAVCMNPLDVVSTRMFNQSGGTYTTMWSCISGTVRAEGVLALWRGTSAQYLRIGPHTVLTFLFWEQSKKLWLVADE